MNMKEICKNLDDSIYEKIAKRWSDRVRKHKYTLHFSDEKPMEYHSVDMCTLAALTLRNWSNKELRKECRIVFIKVKDYTIKLQGKDLEETVVEGLPDLKDFKEYWLKWYLKNNSEKYGLEILEDLDRTQARKHGDLKGVWKGDEVIIEVEKLDTNFLEHNHKVRTTKSGMELNFANKIDLVFTLPPKKAHLQIPVIYADRQHFLKWMYLSKEKKRYTDFLLLYTYEIFRRKFSIEPHNPIKYCPYSNKESCIYPGCRICILYPDIETIKGTPQWQHYQLIILVGDTLLYKITKEDIMNYRSFKEYLNALDEGLRSAMEIVPEMNEGENIRGD